MKFVGFFFVQVLWEEEILETPQGNMLPLLDFWNPAFGVVE